jgi:sulfoquinovosidase
VRFVLVVFVLLAGCPPTPANTFTLSSGSTSVEVTLEPFSFRVVGASGEVLRSRSEVEGAYGRFAPTLDRPTFVSGIVPGWDDYRPGDGTWVHGGKARLIERSTTRAVVEWNLDADVARLELSIDGDRVRVQAAAQGGDAGEPSIRYNKTSLAFVLPEDEHFFGLGERFATFDHRGWSMYSWAEEGPLGAGEGVPPGLENPYPLGPSMTYFPVPFFLSSRGYGLHVDTDFRSELHLGSEKADGWRVAVNARRFAFTVYVHDDPLDTLDAFTADTGRPLIPAPWVFGPRRRSNRDTRVPDAGVEWQVMRDRKMPITAIDDALHFLPALSHVGQEAELREWTRTLHANGYKALAYNNPYVAQNSPRSEADFAFGKDNGFFVKDPKGDPSLVFLISGTPLQVGMIDFTNDKATAWYRSLLKRTVDLGYDGWMHDFGEYVPRNARLADGRRGDEFHNPYPRYSAQAARDVLQAALPDDHLFFVRAGYTGSQAVVPAVWGGDAETSFDETQGIPSTIRSGLNLALVGVPYWGSDGTGFKCLGNDLRDKEVFVRWLQIEAVSPIMMEQDACANPLGRRTKWSLWSDQDTQDVYRRMASLHTRLQPYFMVLAREAHTTGHPLMRPLFLRWPREPRSWRTDDTFFLGPALYAAPVLKRGQFTRPVWFPPGARYVAVDDFTVFGGDQEATVPAPLDRLPLFLVEGQLLPLLDPEVQTLAPATVPGIVTAASRADVLDVQVALGPTGEAKLELFDGTKLTARRVSGNSGREGFNGQADPSQCEKCFSITTRPQVVQVRVTSELAASSSIRFEELELDVRGSTPRRIRWDVLRLP